MKIFILYELGILLLEHIISVRALCDASTSFSPIQFCLIFFNFLAVMFFTLFGQAEHQDSPIRGWNLFLTALC